MNENKPITTDLGVVTAYAAAVEKGYTGTRDDFGQLLANFAGSAQQVADDREAVKEMKNAVDQAANSFDVHVEEKKTEASESITAAVEEGKKNFVTDNTLTIPGRAADAKVTGDKIGELKEDFVDETNRAMNRENEIEKLFTMPTQEAVNTWLDEHPEATTTVQDGSINENKFVDALRKKKANYYISVEKMKEDTALVVDTVCVTLGYYEPNDGGGATYRVRKKITTDVNDGGSIHILANDDFVAELIVEDYVTPEMFGAKGDGVIDDTDDIQKSVSYGVLKGVDVHFASNYFVRNETIRVNGKCKLSGHGKIIKQPVEYSEDTEKAHNGTVFFITGDNITIDGLSFESTKKYAPSLDVINSSTTDQKASNTSAITALNCSYLTVCNIKTKNMNAISINKVTNCIISSSYFNLAENGIYSDDSEAIISDCYFLMDNLKSTYYHALYIKNGSSITSNHCNFYVDGDDFYVGPLFAERTDEGLDKKSVVIIDSFEVVANCIRLYLAYDSKLFLLKNGTYINDRIRSTEDNIGKSYSGCNKIEISNCHFDVDSGYFDTSGVDTTIKDCEIIVHNFNTSSLFTGGNISLMNCLVDIKIMVNGFVVRPAYKTSLVGCKIRIGQGSLRFNTPTNLEILTVIGCIFERNDTANNSFYIFYSSDYSLYRVANNLFFGKIQKVYNESSPKVDNSFINNVIN